VRDACAHDARQVVQEAGRLADQAAQAGLDEVNQAGGQGRVGGGGGGGRGAAACGMWEKWGACAGGNDGEEGRKKNGRPTRAGKLRASAHSLAAFFNGSNRRDGAHTVLTNTQAVQGVDTGRLCAWQAPHSSVFFFFSAKRKRRKKVFVVDARRCIRSLDRRPAAPLKK
jgi:hypothetical protein